MIENDIYGQPAEVESNLLGGIIGALIGALIGAVVWMLVGKLGYIAGIVGFLIAFLASKGYDLLKGRKGTLKVIVLIVCVILAIGAGTVGTAVWEIHDEYSQLTDVEKKYMYPAESEVIRLCLADSELQGAMLKDAAIGLLFGFLGAFDVIRGARKKQNTTEAPRPAVESAGEQPSMDMNKPA